MRHRRQPRQLQSRRPSMRLSKNPKPPAHLNSPRDERVMALEIGLLHGTVSVVGATVPLKSLQVHHPQTLHRVREGLRKEPARRAALVSRVLEGAVVWHVYRDESGALVMYDEYAAYLVALELGCQTADVKILAP